MNIKEYVQELVKDNLHLRKELEKMDRMYKNHRQVVNKVQDQLKESKSQNRIYFEKINQLKQQNISLVDNVNKISFKVTLKSELFGLAERVSK